jgi:hypothetical protein
MVADTLCPYKPLQTAALVLQPLVGLELCCLLHLPNMASLHEPNNVSFDVRPPK